MIKKYLTKRQKVFLVMISLNINRNTSYSIFLQWYNTWDAIDIVFVTLQLTE